jgi:hypothetical protein
VAIALESHRRNKSTATKAGIGNRGKGAANNDFGLSFPIANRAIGVGNQLENRRKLAKIDSGHQL